MWSSPLRLPIHITAAAAITAAGVALASCASPCRELSDKICGCEPTESERLACTTRVENAEAEVVVSDAEMQVCADILAAGECTCDALANGDLAACGLAIDE